jgi:hypothetical protein
VAERVVVHGREWQRQHELQRGPGAAARRLVQRARDAAAELAHGARRASEAGLGRARQRAAAAASVSRSCAAGLLRHPGRRAHSRGGRRFCRCSLLRAGVCCSLWRELQQVGERGARADAPRAAAGAVRDHILAAVAQPHAEVHEHARVARVVAHEGRPRGAGVFGRAGVAVGARGRRSAGGRGGSEAETALG